jgi:hypothetical protein
LHKLVDQAVGRILDALEASGMADDTIIVFTSDHGDLLGAHGGLQQKWANAFDEATRVPMIIKGPGVASIPGGISSPTSHVDLIPTLLGLAGIDVQRAAAEIAQHHSETRPLPGRDLSGIVTGGVDADSLTGAIYFMTEDNVTSAQVQANVLTGEPFSSLEGALCIESIVTTLPTGNDGAPELWKLNHYYERLDEWNANHGIPTQPGTPPAAESAWELHNLTIDPEERTNRSTTAPDEFSQMRAVLNAQRDEKRLLPRRPL